MTFSHVTESLMLSVDVPALDYIYKPDVHSYKCVIVTYFNRKSRFMWLHVWQAHLTAQWSHDTAYETVYPDINISQGSVATCLRCGGIVTDGVSYTG